MRRFAPALLLAGSACVSPLQLLDAGGTPPDAGSDGGGLDAGGFCDGGAAMSACAVDFASCTVFQDFTQGGATISFGGILGTQYSPQCIQVRVGQVVTFSGNFGTHPLTQSCGPDTLIPQTPSGLSAAFAPCQAGLYGYYCRQHGMPDGTGMAGAIQVVP
jgi:plastocyanin